MDYDESELFFQTRKSLKGFGGLLLIDWVWNQVVKINDPNEPESFRKVKKKNKISTKGLLYAGRTVNASTAL